jgi:PEGA domain
LLNGDRPLRVRSSEGVQGLRAIRVCLRLALLILIGAACGGQVWAQATAEAASATAGVSATMSKGASKPKGMLARNPGAKSKEKQKKEEDVGFLPIRPSESAIEKANRRELEAKVGGNGAILVLRSIPSNGEAWVNGKAVGSTPLLLTLPPGSYSIEVGGPRMRFVRGEVALLPKEKRQFVVHLKQRYPSEIRLRER